MIKVFKPESFRIRETCLEAEKLFQKWKVSGDYLNDIVLSIDEALTNIREHGFRYLDECNQKITIEIMKLENNIIVIISDNSNAYSIDDVAKIDHSEYLKSNIIGGFGINLIKKLMDSVKLLRIEERNILLMTKELKLENR